MLFLISSLMYPRSVTTATLRSSGKPIIYPPEPSQSWLVRTCRSVKFSIRISLSAHKTKSSSDRIPLSKSALIVKAEAITGILYFFKNVLTPLTWSLCSCVIAIAFMLSGLISLSDRAFNMLLQEQPTSISIPCSDAPTYVQLPSLELKSGQNLEIIIPPPTKQGIHFLYSLNSCYNAFFLTDGSIIGTRLICAPRFESFSTTSS